MTDMMLYSPIQKASLSNEYNKLCSHHFKDPVRWGVKSPLRTYILRDKLSREFAKLFNLNVFHANMGLRFLQKSH